jgi:hypothetical protein
LDEQIVMPHRTFFLGSHQSFPTRILITGTILIHPILPPPPRSFLV